MSQYFRYVGGRFVAGHAIGMDDVVFLEKHPSISAKNSINLPIIVLFLSKISIYEGFLLFLPPNKEGI